MSEKRGTKRARTSSSSSSASGPGTIPMEGLFSLIPAGSSKKSPAKKKSRKEKGADPLDALTIIHPIDKGPVSPKKSPKGTSTPRPVSPSYVPISPTGSPLGGGPVSPSYVPVSPTGSPLGGGPVSPTGSPPVSPSYVPVSPTGSAPGDGSVSPSYVIPVASPTVTPPRESRAYFSSLPVYVSDAPKFVGPYVPMAMLSEYVIKEEAAAVVPTMPSAPELPEAVALVPIMPSPPERPKPIPTAVPRYNPTFLEYEATQMQLLHSQTMANNAQDHAIKVMEHAQTHWTHSEEAAIVPDIETPLASMALMEQAITNQKRLLMQQYRDLYHLELFQLQAGADDEQERFWAEQQSRIDGFLETARKQMYKIHYQQQVLNEMFSFASRIDSRHDVSLIVKVRYDIYDLRELFVKPNRDIMRKYLGELSFLFRKLK